MPYKLFTRNISGTLKFILNFFHWEFYHKDQVHDFHHAPQNIFHKSVTISAFHICIWNLSLVWFLRKYLQWVTKIVKIAPAALLFNVDCKFAWSFLTTIAWHNFSKLGATLNQGRGEIVGIFEQFWHFLGVFHENIVSLNNFCDWLQFSKFGFTNQIWIRETKRFYLLNS